MYGIVSSININTSTITSSTCYLRQERVCKANREDYYAVVGADPLLDAGSMLDVVVLVLNLLQGFISHTSDLCVMQEAVDNAKGERNGMHLPLHPTNQQPLPFINAERILIQIIQTNTVRLYFHLFKYIHQYGFFLRPGRLERWMDRLAMVFWLQ